MLCGCCGKELKDSVLVCDECGAYVYVMQEGENYRDYIEKIKRIKSVEKHIVLDELDNR